MPPPVRKESSTSILICPQASLWSSYVWAGKPLENSWSWKIWICPWQVGFGEQQNIAQFYLTNLSVRLPIPGLFLRFRNCLQYEPDHPIYLRTLSLVHSHISESGNFDTLLATRYKWMSQTCLPDKNFAGIMGRWFLTCAGTSSKTSSWFILWWMTGIQNE